MYKNCDFNKFNKLLTAHGENLPETPWDIYPRPKFKRDSFFNLNGYWDFKVFSTNGTMEYDGKILVPFSPESILSGINYVFNESSTLHYTKTFNLPENFNKGKVILHFGAVDQIAKIYVNGCFVAEHIGGYIPFSVDITKYLQQTNVIKVKVNDNLSKFILPYGKQCYNRSGMWYTPTSGIWQTVWLESVPINYIEKIDVKVVENKATIKVFGVKSATITVYTSDGEITKQTEDQVCKFIFDNPEKWSPENPYLYYFDVKTGDDKITSYFAIRDLSIKEYNGIKRLCLNGKPYFFHGLLDQGYYSDGLLTPASPELFESEIKKVKALGFNTLRKHIKIEPQTFYYDCDRLGIIVWQDMINNGNYKFFRDTVLPTIGLIRKKDKHLHRNKLQRKAFIDTMTETVNLLKEHPSIVCWTIFNEGWGQFDSDSAYDILKNLDDTRFIDTTSGWFENNKSDLKSLHIYFRKLKIKRSKKPIVISEFGGYAHKVDGHTFHPTKIHGYGITKTRKEFVDRIRKTYIEEVLPLIKSGLCATIYTQVSDIEDEINGLITYDRKVDKIKPEEFIDISKSIYAEYNKIN